MATITQVEAVAAINHLIVGIKNLSSLNDEFIPVVLDWVNNGVGAILNALPTTALNADGTLGTADGSPNSGHPIDSRVVTGIAESAMTPFQIGVAFNIMQQVLALCAGQAVSTEASAPAILGAARA